MKKERISFWKHMKQAWGAGVYLMLFVFVAILTVSIIDYYSTGSAMEIIISLVIIKVMSTICFIDYYLRVLK